MVLVENHKIKISKRSYQTCDNIFDLAEYFRLHDKVDISRKTQALVPKYHHLTNEVHHCWRLLVWLFVLLLPREYSYNHKSPSRTALSWFHTKRYVKNWFYHLGWNFHTSTWAQLDYSSNKHRLESLEIQGMPVCEGMLFKFHHRISKHIGNCQRIQSRGCIALRCHVLTSAKDFHYGTANCRVWAAMRWFAIDCSYDSSLAIR